MTGPGHDQFQFLVENKLPSFGSQAMKTQTLNKILRNPFHLADGSVIFVQVNGFIAHKFMGQTPKILPIKEAKKMVKQTIRYNRRVQNGY